MCLKKHFSGSPSVTEVKFRLRFFRCQLDHIHFVQLFLTGHSHVSGGYTGLVPCNKILQFTDFLLLAAISCLQLGFFHRIDLLKMIVIAHITVQLLIFHMINKIHHFI